MVGRNIITTNRPKNTQSKNRLDFLHSTTHMCTLSAYQIELYRAHCLCGYVPAVEPLEYRRWFFDVDFLTPVSFQALHGP